jgi:AcrR family transcriptional regulator
MVQTAPAKRRGRPPAYDADTALSQAMATFWKAGYAATSLDDITAATGMNRPSLYAAFGDKRAIYLKALERYGASAQAAFGQALTFTRPLREDFERVFATALDIYTAGDDAQGCFMISTATVEATHDPQVREALTASLRRMDAAFESRLRFAAEKGEALPSDDLKGLAQMAGAILHTIAIRSRAGETRAQLDTLVASGLDLICGRKA